MWALPVVVTGLAALHQAWLYAVLRSLAPEWHPWAQLGIYGLTGIVVAYFGLRWIADAVERRERAEAQLEVAYQNLQRAHRQLVLLHELGKKLAGAVDVHEVLAVAARFPVELVDAAGTAVVYFDPEQDRPHLELTWGLGDEAASRLEAAVRDGLESEACRTCQPLTARLNQNCPLINPIRDLARQEGIGSVVCLPLSLGERRLAVIASYLRQTDGPSEDRTRALDVLAAELTSALEGVRLRSKLMATLYAASHIPRSPGELGEALQQALQVAVEGWDAEFGAVLLLEEDGQTWSVRAQHNLGPVSDHRFELVLRLAKAAAQQRRPLILPRTRGLHGLRSVACAPLEAEGRVLGALFLGCGQPGRFALSQADVLGVVANQVALSIRNAELYRRLREAALVEERYRLSREIHDGLAQTLGLLGLQAERAERLVGQGRLEEAGQELAELRQAVRAAYLDVREAIDGLRVTADAGESLASRLRRLAGEFGARTGLEVKVMVDEAPAGGLEVPPETQLHLLRIAQEALSNVRKHARARRAEVRLVREGPYLELTVADDGQGFDPQAPRSGHHLGLATMRERARSLGGHLTVATGIGRGTRVTVRLPQGAMEGTRVR